MIYNKIIDVISKRGAAYVVLIDPDLKNENKLEKFVYNANESEVDMIFVGGSLMMDSRYNERISLIKKMSKIPIVFFPGNLSQLNNQYDAMLFMSVISGRNPHYLIGEQVIAAPIINDIGIETIPTAYLIFNTGTKTTVEFMSGSVPIPMDRTDIAVAHSLAAKFLGFKLIYLEAGSGAKKPISNKLVKNICKVVDVPLVVGGGIRTPEVAESLVKSGASIIVTGSVIEENQEKMKNFSDAIHWKP
tara:strand:+ start:796 stop:1533 length:738 start_codon:yes stop_codon:yes gene_type:complete